MNRTNGDTLVDERGPRVSPLARIADLGTAAQASIPGVYAWAVTVAPAAGTLASGQSTTVTLTASSPLAGLRMAESAGAVGACADCTLTVNPGNITVTVVLEISVGNSSSPPPSSPPPDDTRPAALVARLVN